MTPNKRRARKAKRRHRRAWTREWRDAVKTAPDAFGVHTGWTVRVANRRRLRDLNPTLVEEGRL